MHGQHLDRKSSRTTIASPQSKIIARHRDRKIIAHH
jgi:hypothetical protein